MFQGPPRLGEYAPGSGVRRLPSSYTALVIRLYSFHAVRPARLADQRGMFERLTAEEHEFVMANDGQNEADATAMSQSAVGRSLRSEPRNGRAKPRCFTRPCDGLLTAELTLPQTAAPAVPPWPAEAP
jgi:hypothetical protein